PKKLGKSRMPIGNAIRMMCRAKKSREGDHFHAAVGLANLLEGEVPELPDWAFDQHTVEGRRLGRGLEHFRNESTKLHPPPKAPDPYEDEAYRLWALKQQIERDGAESEPESRSRPAPDGGTRQKRAQAQPQYDL